MLQSALSAIFDPEYESDLLQVSARPPIINDNFIQQHIRNTSKYYGDQEKGIIKLGIRGTMQYLRYQEPAYQPLVLKGKKQSLLPADLKTALLADKNLNDYLYLWEESRDILSDKNYKILTVASVQHADEQGKVIPVNKKPACLFIFCPANFIYSYPTTTPLQGLPLKHR